MLPIGHLCLAHASAAQPWEDADISTCKAKESTLPVPRLCEAHACAAQPWEDAEMSTCMSMGVHSALSACRTCLLGPDTNTTTLCVYAYFIAGISILATIIVSIFLVSCAVTRHGHHCAWLVTSSIEQTDGF